MIQLLITVSLILALSPAAPRNENLRDHRQGQQETTSPELGEAARLSGEVLKLSSERKFEEALPLAKRAIELREKVLGSNHELVASALNNLAYIYLSKFQYAEAEPLYRRSLSILEKKFGNDSKNLIPTIESLALIHFAQKDFGGSEKFYLRGLTIREKAFGPDHPEVTRSLIQLARFYDRMEKFSRSLEYYKRSLAIEEKVLGPNSPGLVELLENCACALMFNGKIPEAMLYRDRAAKLRGAPPSTPVNRGVLQGSAILRVEPLYPDDARRHRVSGSVVVEVTVDECGLVINTRPLSGPGELRRAAEDAARQWRFAPTKLVGVPVKIIGTITFNFNL
ncbi:MAG TPA: TonB family protein [Blastocatellia bacterium]|nr:TonB family protein [Blastocatellia bacterium]